MIKKRAAPFGHNISSFLGGLPLAVEVPVHVPNPTAISKLCVAIDKLGR